MNLELPAPVADYFLADLGDGEGLSLCFTEDAIVEDEGHTYEGRAAIQEWKEVATKKYQYTCQPLACEQVEDRTMVTSRITGNFPGSPVDLRFFFNLEQGKISRLQVLP